MQMFRKTKEQFLCSVWTVNNLNAQIIAIGPTVWTAPRSVQCCGLQEQSVWSVVCRWFLSELRPHFTLASESDPAEQEDLDDDSVPQGNAGLKDIVAPVALHDDTVATSGVSTLSSTVSHESQSAQRSISMELGRMKLETKRYPFCFYLQL